LVSVDEPATTRARKGCWGDLKPTPAPKVTFSNALIITIISPHP
jgi:hypothetical protein